MNQHDANTSLHTTHILSVFVIQPDRRQSANFATPHTQRAPETTDGMSSEQPYKTVAEKEASQSNQIKAKIACIRCRGEQSRCSGQQPCGGGSNDGLGCVWGDDEAKSKRTGRNTALAQGKRRTVKAKKLPVQVRSACTRCQHRKARCSGSRPACAYCLKRQLDCSYDVAEGATRTSDLKRRLKESKTKTHAFGRILATMREGNIYQATEVLAKLRMGETPRDILQSLPTSIASPSPHSDSEQSNWINSYQRDDMASRNNSQGV